MIAAPIGIAVRKNGKCAITATKFEVKKFAAPQNAYLGLAPRIRVFSLPVARKAYQRREGPGLPTRKSARFECTRDLHGHSSFRDVTFLIHAEFSISNLPPPADSLRTFVCATANCREGAC